MVYKKIGSKIPSLSSLLLAGLLFAPGGCNGCGDTDSANASPNDDQSREQSKIKQSKEQRLFAEAQQKVMQVLFSTFDLNSLEAGKAFVLKPEEYKYSDVLTIVKGRLIPSFARGSYPEQVKRELALLKSYSDMDDKTIASEVSSPRAFAKLINNIPVFWNQVVDCYDQIKSLPENPQLAENLKNQELPRLLLHLDVTRPECLFLPSFSVGDSSASRLLKGPRLVRFMDNLNDKNEIRGAGDNKDHSYATLQALLDKRGDCVLVKKKTDISACPESEILEGTALATYLSKRGGALGHSNSEDDKILQVVEERSHKDKRSAMKLKKEKVKFHVPRLQNGGLKKQFNFLATVDYLKNLEDQTAPLIQATEGPQKGQMVHAEVPAPSLVETKASCLFEDYSPSGHQDEDENNTPACSVEATLKTLLFTLFRGDSESDIFSLHPISGSSNSCHLRRNKSSFEEWATASNDEQNFLSKLQRHVENNQELKDLFCIPDTQDIADKLIPPMVGEDSLANGDCRPNGEPTESSMFGLVCKKIIQEFAGQPDSGSLLKKARAIGLLHGTDLVSQSNLSFYHKVLISVAKEITDPAYVDSTMKKEGDIVVLAKLKSKIEGLIKDESRFAIFTKRKDGAVESTDTTYRIRQCILAFKRELDKKNKVASMTYQNIEDATKAKSKDSVGFKIKNVRLQFEVTCQALQQILQLDIPAILTSPDDGENTALSTALDELHLGPFPRFDVDRIAKIRESYRSAISQDKKIHEEIDEELDQLN